MMIDRQKRRKTDGWTDGRTDDRLLWLSFASAWARTEKVICLAWDLVSRSHIILHFGAKVAKSKQKN